MRRGAFVAEDPKDGDHEAKAEDQAHDRGDEDEDEGLVPSSGDNDAPSGAHDSGAGHAADQSVR